MNRNRFSGWMDIFGFTIKQTTMGKSFKITTFLIALLFFSVVTLAIALPALIKQNDDNKTEEFYINTVYVQDESGFEPINFNDIFKGRNLPLANVNFITMDTGITNQEIIKNMTNPTFGEVILRIEKKDESYSMVVLIPEGSNIKDSDGEVLLQQILPIYDQYKISQVGLSADQISSINMPITTSIVVAGEAEESIGEMLVRMLAPMLFALILYMMILLYGQSICKSLVTEKTSKLMELLLTSVKPYAIITGKILAMFFLALMQIIIWIVSGVGGYVVGGTLAKSINPNYKNSIMTLIDLIRTNTNSTAFSVSVVILAFIALCIGFLFYSVLSGIIGAIINKAEDLSSGMAMFQIPVVASFMLSYFIPLNGNVALLNIIRYVPFTSPFLLPAELIIGNVSILQGITSLIVLLLSTFLLILLTGKVYKNTVLYHGNKFSLKSLFHVTSGK